MSASAAAANLLQDETDHSSTTTFPGRTVSIRYRRRRASLQPVMASATASASRVEGDYRFRTTLMPISTGTELPDRRRWPPDQLRRQWSTRCSTWISAPPSIYPYFGARRWLQLDTLRWKASIKSAPRTAYDFRRQRQPRCHFAYQAHFRPSRFPMPFLTGLSADRRISLHEHHRRTASFSRHLRRAPKAALRNPKPLRHWRSGRVGIRSATTTTRP